MVELLHPLQPGASLKLPILAADQDLTSADFTAVEAIRGGMGLCIRVRHEETGREYALKTILPSGLEQELAYRRFAEEIKIWITLSSNGGIVPAYCIERVNEVPCVCTRWMEHGSLRKFLSLKSPQFFFETIDRLARTLGWAWNTYLVVHRDLKPDNLLFDLKDWPHVADWGIARTVLGHRQPGAVGKMDSKTPADLRLTMPGSFLGTLPYASPEQLIDATSADYRSDIYSLGCIMFEWETGTPPFFEGSPKDIAYAHIYKIPPKLGGWLSKSHFGAEKVIGRCLEKRPENRFQSYDELAKALAEASAQRRVSWNSIPISQSPLMPRVGWDQYGAHIAQDKSAVRSKDGRYTLVDGKRYEPFVREAAALMGLGEWQKAANILGRLFIPEMLQSDPDIAFLQGIAVNYANCLMNLGKNSEALQVFRTISLAKTKPAEFFVNYSNALNYAHKFREAEAVAREGLDQFPTDKDILGNLTISLTGQEKLPEAIDTATDRLKLGRDVHSLQEAAGILHSLGGRSQDDNWPKAFELYTRAVDLLAEAKRLNPRYLIVRFSLAQAWFDLEQYSRADKELADFFHMPMDDHLRERCVGLAAQCRLWVSLFKECIEFADKWLTEFPKSIYILRPRAEAFVDGFVIGHVEDGVRIVEESSLDFFESVIKDAEHRSASDFCFLARLKNWMGFTDEALEILAIGSVHFPFAWNLSFHRADILLVRGEPGAALPFAQDAAVKGKWHLSSWELLAEVLHSLSAFEEEATARKRAIEVKAEKEKLKRTLSVE